MHFDCRIQTMPRPRSGSMSWNEMEKELASDHGVPVGQLRKVRLVSELQGLLERHRSAANVKTEIVPNNNQPSPARHLSLGDSPDASDTSDTISTGKTSPEPPHGLSSIPEEKQDAVQSLLMVAPRARSDSLDLSSSKKSDAMLMFPAQVTPMQTMRRMSIVTGKDPKNASVNSIEPNERVHQVAALSAGAQMSPARLSTASILGKLGSGGETKKLPPKMRLKRFAPPQEPEKQEPEKQEPEKQEPEKTPETTKIGSFSPKSRKELLVKFHAKRRRRTWRRKVRYGCRKEFANNRVRVKGRFVKKKEGDSSSYLLPGHKRPRSDSMASDTSVESLPPAYRPRSDSMCSASSDFTLSEVTNL